MAKLLSDKEILERLRQVRSDPQPVAGLAEAYGSASQQAAKWGGSPTPLWSNPPVRGGLENWDQIAKQGYVGAPAGYPNVLYDSQAIFPAYLVDLDTPAGAWRQMGVLLGGSNASTRVSQAMRFLRGGNFAGFWGELFAASQEAGYELSHMAYSLALSVREWWQAVVVGWAKDLQTPQIIEAFNTIPLQVVSRDFLQYSLGFSGQWGERYKSSDGFVTVPLVAPYPEGLRVRVSSQSQELPYLLGSLPGAYTSRPAAKEIAIKNLYLDLRPLAAYLLRSTEADQALSAYVRGTAAKDALISNSVIARIANVVLAYLEFLAKPDPALGRKHRLALRYGHDRFGVPPGYLTIESFDYETMIHSPGGSVMLAQVNLELREWAGLDW